MLLKSDESGTVVPLQRRDPVSWKIEKYKRRATDEVKDLEDIRRHERLFSVSETAGFVIDGQTDD